MKQIFYTFNATSWPADPTPSDTEYIGPITYQVGFYKAIVKDGNNFSQVTPVRFSPVSLEDYIAYYSFTGNTEDTTGNYNATNRGATLTTGINGLPNTAYSFAVNQPVRINAPTPLLTGTVWSISFYFMVDTTSAINADRIIYSQYNYQTNPLGRMVITISPNTTRLKLFIQNNNGNLDKLITDTLNSEWNHVVVTSNGSTVSIYLNKSLVSNDGVSVEPSTVNSVFGAYIWESIYIGSFGGKLDEIKVYNRALNSSEVILL